MKKWFKDTLKSRNAWAGRLFCLPFYIGFLLFFLMPLIQSVLYAFGQVSIEVGRIDVKWIGWDNFYYIFRQDTTYADNLLSSILGLLYQVPVILISSLFFALLLNGQFVGRTLARAVFFIPVIVASGVVIEILKGDLVAGSMMSGAMAAEEGAIFNSSSLQGMLVDAGLNEQMVTYFTNISNNLFDLLWRTGIQMILFLAGLQTIPRSLYEASSIEGATAWENFWMITLPMLTPIVLVNVVYTVVDSFTDAGNPVMEQILTTFSNTRYSQASAMSWAYFLLIAVILVVVIWLFSRVNREPKPAKQRGRSRS